MTTKLRAIAALVLALAGLATVAPHATALERGMFGWRAAEVSGTRPLLVIWIREPDAVAPEDIAKYRTNLHDTQ
jgi:hypothetical protein